MEIENVEQLLDFVFTEEDISDAPSLKEYKKLTRIMTVMVRFYVRGEDLKRVQYESLEEEVQKIETNEKMIEAQRKSLQPFPSFHPKRTTYEEELDGELAELQRHKKKYTEQAAHYRQLYEWGQGIVATMHWLEKNLKHYANQELHTNFEGIEDIKVSTEEFKRYRRGLDEVTYNLQESQDFFEASLDGRLNKYHQLEKCMIEAQLKAIREFPEDNERRRHVELELEKDLQYVCDNMEDNPKVRRHRERMQEMHKDFFAILRWQRRKIDQILAEEPEKIIGDVDKLKEELAKGLTTTKEWNSKWGEKKEGSENAPVATKSAASAGCPVGFSSAGLEKKEEGYIHKLYEKDP